MARMRFVTMLLGVLVAEPVLAHPGHGVPGWWHHGEAVLLAAFVIGGLVAWRRTARSTPRRGES